VSATLPAVYRLVDGPPCSSQAAGVVAEVFMAHLEQTKETGEEKRSNGAGWMCN
jgi:hypothetical protein